MCAGNRRICPGNSLVHPRPSTGAGGLGPANLLIAEASGVQLNCKVAVKAFASIDPPVPLAFSQNDLKVARGVLNSHAQRWAKFSLRLELPGSLQDALSRSEGDLQRNRPLIE